MKKIAITSMLILSAFVLNGCFEDKKETQTQKEVIPANEYHLSGLDGKKYIVKKEKGGFILKENKDKILILDIFATWCPPCKAAATHLSSLQDKFKDDLVIIGLTIENPITNEKLQDFRTKYNANYILVNSSENERLIEELTTDLQVGKRFPIPLMAIYKNSKLINYYAGAAEEEFIENDIKIALEK